MEKATEIIPDGSTPERERRVLAYDCQEIEAIAQKVAQQSRQLCFRVSVVRNVNHCRLNIGY